MALTKIDDRGLKTPIDLLDNEKIRLGTGNDFKIWHDGTNSLFENVTGTLKIGCSNNVEINGYDGHAAAKFINDGAVELYYDNVKKLETTSSGVDITGSESRIIGDLRFDNSDHAGSDIFWDQSSKALEFADGVGAVFGNGDDLQIYHDPQYGHSWIKEIGSGGFNIATNIFEVYDATPSEKLLTANANGGVELYYDNTKKLETRASDVCVHDDLYLDDNIKIKLGGANDLQIFHDGSNSQIREEGTGNLMIITDNQIRFQKASPGEDIAVFNIDTAVELYYDASKKFETTADGAKVTCTTGTGLEINQTHTAHGQGPAILINATGSYNDGYIRYNLGTETSSWALGVDDTQDEFGLYFGGSTTAITPDTAGRRITATEAGAVELYYDDSVKLETKTDGVAITGNTYFDPATAEASPATGSYFQASSAGRAILIIGGTSTNASSNKVIFQNPNGTVGSITTDANATNFNTSSDYRLKENAVAISDGITRLKTLKPYRFNFKADATTTVDGFFAHEITAVPEAVSGTKDGVVTQALINDGDYKNATLGDPVYQGIDQSKLVPLLTAALQEAITKIETLETKVAALESS